MSKKRNKKNKEVVEIMTEDEKEVLQNVLETDDVNTLVEGDLGETEDPIEGDLGETEDPVEGDLGETEDPVEGDLGETEDPIEGDLGETEDKEEYVKVTAKKLNVRKEPDPESTILMVVNENDVFKIIDNTPLYFGLQINDNVIGYCKKDFVEKFE